MTVKQLSVFVENKPGTLAQITDVLETNKIDMRALSLADTERYGILRLIVDAPTEAQNALRDAGFKVSLTEVIAVAVSNQPGGLSKVLHCLADAKIAVEYMYAFISQKTDTAYVILRVQENQAAISALGKSGITIIPGKEIYGK